jgi:succinate dehydrogenase/fumarate reductase flavoprotein subunit
MSVDGYSIEEYVRDVIDVGRYINRRSLVKLVALRSIRCIRSLERLDLRFRSSRDNLWVVGSDPAFLYVLRNYALSRPNNAVNNASKKLWSDQEGLY